MTDKQFYILLGLSGLALWYLKNKAGDVARAVNPVNPENVFYTGVNSVGGAISGKPDFSLGVWVHDLIHGENAGLY